jgi:hypothetical protein
MFLLGRYWYEVGIAYDIPVWSVLVYLGGCEISEDNTRVMSTSFYL